MNRFQNKKIGIWGYGIVGRSALQFFNTQSLQSIEILDNKEIDLPLTSAPITITLQTQDSIQKFLQSNDYILPSPGIKLHNYQQFAHKFINELDLLHNHTNNSIIAITGTVGKTSITHLLEQIIKAHLPSTIAAGNIGYPMLSLIHDDTDDRNRTVILELSSFQLQPIQSFAPNLAIITNFFANHLDHHQSIEEYFSAKCNILRYQTDTQQALIPLNLFDEIANIVPPKKNWALFAPTKPQEYHLENPLYYLDDKVIHYTHNNQTEQIFNISTLPSLTFDLNWLIIVAACHLYKIPLTTIAPVAQNLQLPDHRLQKVGFKNGSTFYNDSKSTVWQATLQAVQAMGNQPIKLFLGGLSKGADRTPLLQALRNKNIEIYAFGKEAEQIAQLCQQFNIQHYQYTTLDAAFQGCTQNISNQPEQILFSPGGSSFDLFQDYQARGQYFTKLVHDYCNE